MWGFQQSKLPSPGTPPGCPWKRRTGRYPEGWWRSPKLFTRAQLTWTVLSPVWICMHASTHHTLGRRWNGRSPEGQRPSNQQYYNSPHSPRDNKHRYRHGGPGCGYGGPLVSRYSGTTPLAVGLRSMLGKRTSRTWDREVCRRYGYMRALPRYMQGFAE